MREDKNGTGGERCAKCNEQFNSKLAGKDKIELSCKHCYCEFCLATSTQNEKCTKCFMDLSSKETSKAKENLMKILEKTWASLPEKFRKNINGRLTVHRSQIYFGRITKSKGKLCWQSSGVN